MSMKLQSKLGGFMSVKALWGAPEWNSTKSLIITGVPFQLGATMLHIPVTYYPNNWLCPSTPCALWPDFAFVSAPSKLSKLLGMTAFFLPVTFVMPKTMYTPQVCSFWLEYASLFPGPILSPSNAFSQSVPYPSSTHHVQSFEKLS
eukprot:1161087-Pelagomonas_calceolata.AAC.2